MKERVKLLKNIVRRAGETIKKMRFSASVRSKKNPLDMLTSADLASEKLIIKAILKHFPKDKILSEETEAEEGIGDTKEYLWVIDPIDGTSNYVRGRSYCGVAIGICKNRKVLAGAFYNPFMEQMYFAEKGKGAYKNGKRIYCSKVEDISIASMVTSTHYERKSFKGKINEVFKNNAYGRLFVEASAVMSVSELANGCFDLYFHNLMKPWDNAASFIIAEESGAVVTDFKGQKIDFFSPEVVIGNPKLVKKFISSMGK